MYKMAMDKIHDEMEYLRWQVDNGLIYGFVLSGGMFYIYDSKEEVR